EVFRTQAAEQFAGIGVGAAVFVGAPGRYVPGGDRRGAGQQVGGLVLDVDRASRDDEVVRKRLDVHRQRGAGVGAQVTGLDRVPAGGEHEVVTGDDEPQRRDVWRARS